MRHSRSLSSLFSNEQLNMLFVASHSHYSKTQHELCTSYKVLKNTSWLCGQCCNVCLKYMISDFDIISKRYTVLTMIWLEHRFGYFYSNLQNRYADKESGTRRLTIVWCYLDNFKYNESDTGSSKELSDSLSEVRSRHISEVIQHPSNVMELQIKKERPPPEPVIISSWILLFPIMASLHVESWPGNLGGSVLILLL